MIFLSKNMEMICSVFLKVHLVGMFDTAKQNGNFRSCNYAFLALLNISFIAIIGAISSRLFGSP